MPDPIAPTAPATPTPPPAPVVDPFIAKLGKNIDSLLKATELPAKSDMLTASGAEANNTDLTLGERAAAIVEAEKAKTPAAPAAPASPIDNSQSPTTTPAAPAAPAATPTVKIERPSGEKVAEELAALRAKLEESVARPPVAPVTPPVTPPAPAAPSADEAYVKALPEQARETVELLQWAGAKDEKLKEAAGQMIGYYKKLDAFIQANPDLTEDSRELNEFKSKNKPAVASSQTLMNIAIDKRSDEKAAAVEAKMRGEMESVRGELHKIQAAPAVESAAKAFENRFLTGSTALPAGLTRVPTDAMKVIQEKGIANVPPEWKPEAKILVGAIGAATEYLSIAKGLKDYDESDELHSWLGQLVVANEQAMVRRPAAQRTLRGKPFLPAGQLQKLAQSNPAEAERYATFGQEDILNMIELNAHHQVTKAYEEAAAISGRQAAAAAPATPVPVTPQTPAPAPAAPAPAETPSPRGGSSKAPGAATPSGISTPESEFMRKISSRSAVILPA